MSAVFERSSNMQFYTCPSTILEMKLSPASIKVYHYLAHMQDNRTSTCWPAKKTIAGALNISKSSVSRALRELKEKQLIKIIHRKDMSRPQGKRQISNLYELVSNKAQQETSSIESKTKSLVRCFKGSFNLTGTELKVYMYLCKRAGKSNICFPSYKVIAADVGISRMTAIRVIQSLIEKNVIKKTKRLHAAYRGGKATGCNIYTILISLNDTAKKFKRKTRNCFYRLFGLLKKSKKENCRLCTDNSSKKIHYVYIILRNIKKSRLFSFFLKKILR